MKEVLVFGGQNSLDFLEVREGVLRIPEVSLRIEQAQKLWDSACGTSFSFQHFLSSEDSSFFNNIQLKSLSLAVVQLGLLDRYRRHFGESDFMVGNTQNDSALLVAAGVLTFQELIAKSQASGLIRPMAPLQVANEPLLRGQCLPQYQAFSKAMRASAQGGATTSVFQPLGAADMSLKKTLQALIDSREVKKVVHIGPGLMDKSQALGEYEMRELQILESIDIDPMLGWFWQDLRKHERGLDLIAQ